MRRHAQEASNETKLGCYQFSDYNCYVLLYHAMQRCAVCWQHAQYVLHVLEALSLSLRRAGWNMMLKPSCYDLPVMPQPRTSNTDLRMEQCFFCLRSGQLAHKLFGQR
jgi:hypothetical protein